MSFQGCALIGLSVWVGGLILLSGVVTPAAFRSLKREEASRFLEVLFPAVDRWACVWAWITVGALAVLFWKRHFEPASLVLEIPVGIMFLLTHHLAYVLHPQIREVKRKINLPEFQGTQHQETMRFAFEGMHRNSVRLHLAILILGFFALALVPRFLR